MKSVWNEIGKCRFFNGVWHEWFWFCRAMNVMCAHCARAIITHCIVVVTFGLISLDIYSISFNYLYRFEIETSRANIYLSLSYSQVGFGLVCSSKCNWKQKCNWYCYPLSSRKFLFIQAISITKIQLCKMNLKYRLHSLYRSILQRWFWIVSSTFSFT